MEAAKYILQQVSPADRAQIEVEMRFSSTIIPFAGLAGIAGLHKEERSFQETTDVLGGVRTRIDVHDGAIECVKKDQLTRILHKQLDRYVHINREEEVTEDAMQPIGKGAVVTRVSFVPSPDDPTCPRIDVTIKEDGTPVLEVECAPFFSTDTDNEIISKCKNFEEMCKVLNMLLGSPLGQFKQPMPIALTRDRLKTATGGKYLTSHKVDGERRLLELRLYLTHHTMGRHATLHLYSSRTMTLLQYKDISGEVRGITTQLPVVVDEEGDAIKVLLLIDAEEVVTLQGNKELQILDITDRGHPEESMERRLRTARLWLPLLRSLLIPHDFHKITVKPYFKEAVLKTRCAESLQARELKMPVDGLIFTPVFSRSNSMFQTIYKWKDTSACTIDLLYQNGKLLVSYDKNTTRCMEDILDHFPKAFRINHDALNAHTVSDGDVLECRIMDDEIRCVGVRKDKVYPNTLKTCLHTLTVVKENVTLQEIIAQFT